MSNNDLENTTKIENLEELANYLREEEQKKNEEQSALENQNETNEEKQEEDNQNKTDKKKKEKKKHFVKLKNWWSKLSKKKKIIVIIVLVILVIAIGVGVFFLVKSSSKKTVEEPPKEEIILEEENYRYENGSLIFLNKDGEELGKYECENKDEKLCFVAYYSDEDNFDLPKKVYEDKTPVLERTPIINDKFVFISDNKENQSFIRIYNIETQEFTEENYQLVKKGNLTDTFILKDTTSNYGTISISDGEIINQLNFSYDYLAYIDNSSNYYLSKQNNRNVIIDKTGKSISKGISGDVKNLTNKYLKTSDSGKYSVYDYSGNLIFNGYDYIELYDDYAALISDNKITLKYYDKTKLHEEEIKLNNTNYIKTDIYDEDKKLKETEEAFNIEETESAININVLNNGDEKTTTLSKLEALNNKNLAFMNYFDGKLYFYTDSLKETILGEYTCNNKNKITSTNTELKNCFIASDTIFEDNELENPGSIGAIPIFNQRFVFINDNPELANNDRTVVLYDLQKKETVSKYKNVNTYSYTGVKDLSYTNVNEIFVVAQNKSDQYGVIKINANGVSAHIPFKYNSIEKIGDYFSVGDNSGYSLLSKTNTNVVASSIAGKIKNYNANYVTGIQDSKYYVYDYNGKKINTEGYKYIALYNNFFAAVNSNSELSLYLYEKPSENIIKKENIIDGSEVIKLELDNYYQNGTRAFRINTSGYNYTVEIGTANDIYTLKASGSFLKGDE